MRSGSGGGNDSRQGHPPDGRRSGGGVFPWSSVARGHAMLPLLASPHLTAPWKSLESPPPRPGGLLLICSQPGDGLEASPWTQARMSSITSHWLTTSPPRVTLVLIRASPLLHPTFPSSFTTSSFFKHHQQTAQSGSISSVWSTILTAYQYSSTD